MRENLAEWHGSASTNGEPHFESTLAIAERLASTPEPLRCLWLCAICSRAAARTPRGTCSRSLLPRPTGGACWCCESVDGQPRSRVISFSLAYGARSACSRVRSSAIPVCIGGAGGACRGRECGNQQLSHDVIGSSLLQVVHAVRLAVDRAAPALVCLEHQASMSAEHAWQVTIWARSDMQSLW